MNFPQGHKLAERLAAALRRMNQRERLLLGAAALATLIFAPLKAYDWVQSAEAANVQAHVDLESAREAAAAGQGQLRHRILQAQGEVRDWSWSAPSVAAGQVILADAVSDVASDAGLTDAQVKAGDQPVKVGDIYLAKVELQTAYDPAGLAKFLQGLDDTGNGFLVDALSIQNQDAAPRLRLVLNLPLSLQPGAGK